MSTTTALVLGRFHAVTTAQARWLASLGDDVEQIVCVITSADHEGTRRNPLPVAQRLEMMRPVLEATGKPFALLAITDLATSRVWVSHVIDQVRAQTGAQLLVGNTRVYTANHDVDRAFQAERFVVVSQAVTGPTPHELIDRIVHDQPWLDEAAPSTIDVYARYGVVESLRTIYAQRLVNEDGELGHARDFASYGSQMDASLRLKLDDVLPFVKPGKIVDKGCGTGKLLVELSRLYEKSAFVGVDLSRELLRVCDENHYFAEDVTFVRGDIIEAHVEPGSASCVILSSVVHEIYSYSGYDRGQVLRALRNAAQELGAGGHVIIRDGLSPGNEPVRLRLLDEQTRRMFERFAVEFKNGEGAEHQRIAFDEAQLSAHLANEFLCKKDYVKNWHIEVNEEYGTFTLDGWARTLKETGFRALELRGYVNPWIAEHRYDGSVELLDERGARLPWPCTNVVVVGEKL